MRQIFDKVVVDLPIRLGEWTLWGPTRRLLIMRLSVLDESVLAFTHPDRNLLDSKDDGFMVAAPAKQPRRPNTLGFEQRMIYRIIDASPRYYVRLDGTFDEYMAQFSQKSRSTLRRKLRKFEKASKGTLDVRFYRGGGFDEFFAAARKVSHESYQEIMFNAGLPDDLVSVNAMRRALENGESIGFLLYLGVEPVAYLYGPVLDGVMEYQYLGYRPAYADLSPGAVLLVSALQHLFDQSDLKVLDFTEGGRDGGYKAFFSTNSISHEVSVWLRVTPANVFVLAAQAIAASVSSAAGSLLDKLGFKRSVRNIMRRLKGAERAGT